MTKEKAKKDCLIKWKYAKDTGCKPIDLICWLQDHHYKIFKYRSECAYCEKYKYISALSECEKCPLKIIAGAWCGDENSNFDKWCIAEKIITRKKYAKLIYDDIKMS